jgi:hypothetical protein
MLAAVVAVLAALKLVGPFREIAEDIKGSFLVRKLLIPLY